MPKGYWIARGNVEIDDGYRRYIDGSRVAFEKYGARPLARGGAAHPMEGTIASRNVVLEFPSVEAAIACYNSPEYQAARAHRAGADLHIVIVEGMPD